MEVISQLLLGSSALLFNVHQLLVVVEHDHELVGVTQAQVRQHRRVLQFFSPLLIGQESLQMDRKCLNRPEEGEKKEQHRRHTLVYLSEFFLFVHQFLAGGDHLVESIQPVLQPSDGLHVLII